MKTATKEMIQNKYDELIKLHEGSKSEVIDGVELYCGDDTLINAKGVAFDGFGFCLGINDRTGRTSLIRVTYPKLKDLTKDDILKIDHYMNSGDKDFNAGSYFTDSLITFGVTEVLMVETLSCLNCGVEQTEDVKIIEDQLGRHMICQNCSATSDI